MLPTSWGHRHLGTWPRLPTVGFSDRPLDRRLEDPLMTHSRIQRCLRLLAHLSRSQQMSQDKRVSAGCHLGVALHLALIYKFQMSNFVTASAKTFFFVRRQMVARMFFQTIWLLFLSCSFHCRLPEGTWRLTCSQFHQTLFDDLICSNEQLFLVFFVRTRFHLVSDTRHSRIG